MAIERLTQIVALPDSNAGVRSLPSIAKLRLVGAAQTIAYLKRFPDWGPSIPSLLNYIHEGTEWAAHRPCLKNDGSHHWIPHWVVCFDCTCQSGCCKGNSTSICMARHWQWHCNVCTPQAESTPRNPEAGSAYRLSPQSPVSKEARNKLWGITTHIQAKGSKFP